MFKLNEAIKYVPKRGTWIQHLKMSEIIKPKIVVSSTGLGFKVSYLNPFERYSISSLGGSEAKDVVSKWKNDPLQLYQGCINFAVFCATSGLGISLEHFKMKKPLAASLVKFHFYYHVRRILYTLKVKLPSDKEFSKYSTNYDKEVYASLCKDYGVSLTWNWSNQYVFSTYQGYQLTYTDANSWARWIMPKSQGLTRQGVEMLSESIRVYVYCLLTAQSSTRSNIIGNTSPNFEAQKLFGKEVEDFVKRNMLLHEDIRRYESVLSNARSPVDYSLGEGIYMLPSDLQLKVSVKKGFTDKLKVGQSVKAGKVTRPRSTKSRVKVAEIKSQGLTLHEQRLSKEHQEELQSFVLLGSLGIVGIIYFLKTR